MTAVLRILEGLATLVILPVLGLAWLLPYWARLIVEAWISGWRKGAV